MRILESFVSDVAAKQRPSTGAASDGKQRKEANSKLLAIFSCLLVSFAVGSTIGCSGSGSASTNSTTTTTTTQPAQASTTLPCDIYFNAGTPCVAAHSTTRALFAAYDGALYQVQRTSDNTTLDIGLLAAGGYANSAAQDTFCSGTYCTVTKIYDQTANHNDLTIGPAGGADAADVGVPANGLPAVAGGHPVYGLSFTGGQGYRNDKTTGIAANGEPEGMYIVASGTHVNNNCCFDYGNAETSATDTGNGHMDAVNFGVECWFQPCVGAGPWVQADLENGLFASDWGYNTNPSNSGWPQPFVSAWLKNDGQSKMALKGGDAQSGTLTTEYAGSLPTITSGYIPMSQEGAIILGIGGDNSNNSVGNFFEGVMTGGYPTDASENDVQANIVSVGYDVVTANTATAGTLVAGAEISIEVTSTGYTNNYLRREGSDGAYGYGAVIASPLTSLTATSDLADATWVVRTGLADPTCFSFESRDYPGEFMRHSNFVLYSQPWTGASGSAQDATFCAVTGNAGSGYSFQSKNYPTKYIREYLGSIFVADNSGSNAWDAAANYSQDTTFLVVNPLQP
jgi:hypothetical protein